MPIAPSVPRITLITVAITATSTVSRSACRMSGLFVNSSMYHLNENPSHLARDLPALNDSAIITAMGEYRNSRMSAR